MITGSYWWLRGLTGFVVDYWSIGTKASERDGQWESRVYVGRSEHGQRSGQRLQAFALDSWELLVAGGQHGVQVRDRPSWLASNPIQSIRSIQSICVWFFFSFEFRCLAITYTVSRLIGKWFLFFVFFRFSHGLAKKNKTKTEAVNQTSSMTSASRRLGLSRAKLPINEVAWSGVLKRPTSAPITSSAWLDPKNEKKS